MDVPTHRILAMDIGDTFVGLAMTTGVGDAVEPLFTLRRTKLKEDAKNIARLLRKHQVAELVAGLPRNMDGTEGKQALAARAFGDAVAAASGMQVVYFDERLTTQEAHQRLNQSGYGTGNRKLVLDQVAAIVLLESYLAERSYLEARLRPPVV
ncbi:Holliday junction resolvase RuvX [Terriglobus tenax]|uniref:Holliday junction resolvase RuvX n=1 Tax=Terriglobus tenax TaxID=1111115 RepID=UPI0021E0406D|nr:Holliday junction resolvase RuvX [Terriglobus tenax]